MFSATKTHRLNLCRKRCALQCSIKIRRRAWSNKKPGLWEMAEHNSPHLLPSRIGLVGEVCLRPSQFQHGQDPLCPPTLMKPLRLQRWIRTKQGVEQEGAKRWCWRGEGQTCCLLLFLKHCGCRCQHFIVLPSCFCCTHAINSPSVEGTAPMGCQSVPRCSHVASPFEVTAVAAPPKSNILRNNFVQHPTGTRLFRSPMKESTLMRTHYRG